MHVSEHLVECLELAEPNRPLRTGAGYHAPEQA
jgi:hypothetical protein